MKLSQEEQELIRAEVGPLVGRVQDPALQAAYRELSSGVEAGEVQGESVRALEGLLTLGLESGRIRAVHTAHGEMIAQRLFLRTPKGDALRRATEEITGALAALQGHSIEEMAISITGPSAYSLTIGTDQGRILIRMDRNGVRLQSLEVGA